MSSFQNQIDRQYTEAELTELESALASLEKLTAGFASLSGADKASLVKPPDSGRGWMQNMTLRAEQNLHLLSRQYVPEVIQRDLTLDAVLEPVELRLNRVLDKIDSARFLARSDAFAALLGARRQLKDAGVTGVDDDLSEGLQRFFRRSEQPAETEPTPPNPPAALGAAPSNPN